MSKYLGIDASTQSITGLLIDAEQRAIVAEASINFDEHFKTTYGVVNGVLDLGAGVVHSAPLMWAEALDLLLQTLADQGHDLGAVRAVAGSGQQHGTVYLNASAGPAPSASVARPSRSKTNSPPSSPAPPLPSGWTLPRPRNAPRSKRASADATHSSRSRATRPLSASAARRSASFTRPNPTLTPTPRTSAWSAPTSPACSPDGSSALTPATAAAPT